MSNEIVNIDGQDEEIVGGILRSVIRTAVPLLVGFVLTLLLKAGVDLSESPEAQANLTAFVTILVSTLYYALIRYAETHYAAQWGWLLGLAKAPIYTKVIDTTGVEIPNPPAEEEDPPPAGLPGEGDDAPPGV